MKYLCSSILTLAALSSPAAAESLSVAGFEDGTLDGWTVYGGASVLGEDTLDLGGSTFELAAKGDFMAKILPDGSSITRDQAEDYLGLTAGAIAGLGVDGIADSTNFGLITGEFDLDPGTYSFGWSYAAQDYAPYDDGVFFTIAGGDVESVSVLASNFTGQDDTVIVGTYGSTPWKLTSFTISTGGTYQLGFGAYNNRDTGYDPILFIDDGLGTLAEDGVVVPPAGASTIDLGEASYPASGIEAGDVLPVFEGGVLEVDAPGVYTSDFTINAGGGTIDTAGLDATFSGDFSGAGAFTKTGAGTLTLTGANSYAGGTTIDEGTLIGDAASLQGDIVNNAALVFDQTGDGQYEGALSGNGGLTKSGAGVLTLSGDSSAYEGDIALEEGGVILKGSLDGEIAIDPGATLQIGDGVTGGTLLADVVNEGGLIFANPGDTDFAGALSGSGALVKEGGGTLVLSGAYNYTGSTIVNGGSVEVESMLPEDTDLQIGSGGSVSFGGGSQQVKSLSGGGGVSINGGALTVSQSGDSEFGGALSGSGTFIKSGPGKLNMTGDSDFDGTVNIMGGVLAANGTSTSRFEVTSGAIGGVGVIGGLIVHTGAAAAPGNSIGTLNVSTDVLFEVDSFFEVETNAAGESDRLVAEGVLTIEGGTVSVFAEEGDYAPLTRYTIAVAEGGRVGTFDDAVADLAYLTPSLSYDATSVYLTLLRNDIDFGDRAVTANQRAIAYAVGRLEADDELRNATLMLGASAAPAAFDSLTGEIHASVQNTMIEDARKMRVATLNRLALVDDERNGAWARAIGSWGRAHGDVDASSLERETTGFMMGVDAPVIAGIRAGLAGAYTDSDMDLNARSSRGHINTAHLTGYAARDVGPVNARFGVSYGWAELETNRRAQVGAFTDQLQAGYDGASLQSFGEIGYETTARGVMVEPFANVTVMRVWMDGFSETGGAAALDVSHRRDTHIFSSFGARLGAPQVGPFSLRGSLAWEHAYGDITPVTGVRFAGGPAMGVFGAPLARDAAAIEAEASFKIGSNGKAGVSYHGQIGDKTDDHAVLAKIAIGF